MKIGLLGLGTVGTGVFRIVNAKSAFWQKKFGEKIEIVSILVKNKNKKRDVDLNGLHLTENAHEIIENKEIDTVIELIGGLDEAYEYIIKSIENGKNVITGNKAVVSKYFLEIIEKVKDNSIFFGYEASVCGGIPIIKTINQIKDINEISSIKGIMNGTTNFILDKMVKEKMEYDLALKLAQEIGYAEADPTADVDGYDAQRKLSILCSIAYDLHLKPEEINCRGIRNITSIDVSAARHMGYIPKLFAHAARKENCFNACVEPVLIDRNDVFASVPGAKNMVAINGNYIGELQLDGEGAGMFPTANAVVSDLLDLINTNKSLYPEFSGNGIKFTGIEGNVNRYYIRITPDSDEEIKQILGRMEEDNVNCKVYKDHKDLIMVSEKTEQKRIIEYIEEINSKGWTNCFIKILD